VEQVLDMTQKIEVYDVLGKYLGNDIKAAKANIVIVKQGNKIVKVIK
jgi:hypothetical protein